MTAAEPSTSSRAKILIADGESHIRWSIAERLGQEAFDCLATANGRDVLTLLEQEGPFDLLLCDMRLPVLSGLELLTAVRAPHPDVAVVMMAALVERRLAVKAMELGASDYVVKPFEMEDLVMRIRSALEKRRLLLENRTYKQQVHEHAEEYSRQLRHHMLLEQRRAVELGEALSALKRAYDSTVETLALALDVRSPLMVGHTRRVAAYTMEMARSMDIGNAELETIGYGAMLHDVGDVAVPEQILNKPTRLDEAELDVMKKHVAFGSRLLNHVDFLRDASAMVLHHHERHDGRGYPGGLAGDRIVRGARIFAVADAFDAMTSPRPYRGPLSYDDACAELIRCSGNQFDPSVVEAFFTVTRTRWVDLRQQAELAVKQWHGEC